MTKTVWSWRHAIQKSPLSSTTKLVLLNLSIHMNDLGEGCYPSTATQAADTGLSERSVCTHLDVAENAGFIRRKAHGYGGQKWARNEYFATWPVGVEVGPKGTEGGSVPSTAAPVDKSVSNPSEGTEGGSVRNCEGTEPDDRKALKEVQSNSTVERYNTTYAPEGAKNDFDLSSKESSIIEAFREALAFVYGKEGWQPNQADIATAKEFARLGADREFCRKFFHGRLATMKANGKDVPYNLKYFSKAVAEAVMKRRKTAKTAPSPPRPEDPHLTALNRAYSEAIRSGDLAAKEKAKADTDRYLGSRDG